MFCKNCGSEINDNADVCIHCGISTQKGSLDNPSHLAGVAGCCFPIVGIILYFLWKDNKPKSADLVCKWTIGGVVAMAMIYVLFFIIGMAGF